ncbi:MAG: hypothetical protein K1X29_08620 [Bdellovibrionales bacterium]|nr:hypothetical protein [Bdellovibrionales bacterium]
MKKNYKNYTLIFLCATPLSIFFFLIVFSASSSFGTEKKVCRGSDDKLFEIYIYPLILLLSNNASRSKDLKIDYLTIRCIEKKLSDFLTQDENSRELDKKYLDKKFNELREIFNNMNDEKRSNPLTFNLNCSNDLFELKISAVNSFNKIMDVTVNEKNAVKIYNLPVDYIIYDFIKNRMVLASKGNSLLNDQPVCVFLQRNLPSGMTFFNLTNYFIKKSMEGLTDINLKDINYSFSCKYLKNDHDVLGRHEAFINNSK